MAWFHIVMATPGTVTIQTLSFAGGVNAAGRDPRWRVCACTEPVRGSRPPATHRHRSLRRSRPRMRPHARRSGLGPLLGCLHLHRRPFGGVSPGPDADDNLAFGPTLMDGYSRTGEGNFTGPNFTGQDGAFVLITGERRASYQALDIQPDSARIVPEPGALQLFAAGTLLICLARITRPNRVCFRRGSWVRPRGARLSWRGNRERLVQQLLVSCAMIFRQ